MKSTRFWIALFSVVLIAAVTVSFFVFRGKAHSTVANIYQDGLCIHSIDLSRVAAKYTLQITGAVTNVIAVEPGRIRVMEATCPDQICVHQGWISNSVAPVVCLPNALVIRIEDTPGAELDAVAR